MPAMADTMPFYLDSIPKTALGVYQTDKEITLYSHPDANSVVLKKMTFSYSPETMPDGVFAVLILLLIDFTPLEPFSVLYYTIISFCVVPLIYTNVLLKQDASSYITCVVFLSIVLSHLGEGNHYVFALTRMLETAFGIVVAIVINMTIKNNDRKEQSNENL